MGLPQLPDGTLLVAIPGLTPTKQVDIAICAVFIAILAPTAARNAFNFFTDKKRGFIFPMSMVLFGFCMARISTFAMRIAWTTHLTNLGVATAAQIFSAAGVVLLYVINMILCQRLIVHLHPRIAKVKALGILFRLYIASLVAMLVLVIISAVNFLKGGNLKPWMINARKAGPVYFTIFAFLPIPLTLLALALPRNSTPGPLGRRSTSTTAKTTVILTAAVTLTIGAAVRAAGNFFPMKMANNSAWYHSKAVFYIFMIVLELVAVYSFMLARFDLMFYSGEGACDYAEGKSAGSGDEETGDETEIGEDEKKKAEERAEERAKEMS